VPEIADAVVVGGGLLGATLAYELARRTLRVTLLEAEGPAAGASGNGFAWVNATSKLENQDYHRLNAEGLAFYSRLAAEFGIEATGIYDGGALFWTPPEDIAGSAELQRRANALRDWGYPATMLNPGEMQALEPRVRFPDDAVGLFAPADLWIDAPRLVRHTVEAALRHSVDLRWHTPATGFTRSITGAISTVETPQGRIATSLLILAAGIETPGLAALAAGLRDATAAPTPAALCPVRREPGLLIETPSGSAPGMAHRILYPPDAAGLHLRPTPAGGLLIGADDADAVVAGPGGNEMLPALAADLLRRVALAIPDLNDYAVTGVADARICVRPVPADGLPIVGPLPGVEGAYILVTHSGITLGPLLAHLLAEELVVGRPSHRLAPYRPSRFQTAL
jgi:glycine/D-amino acid oxidase-like deaminating enzyme